MLGKKNQIITDESQIDELLSRGVVDVIHKESLKKKLLSGKQLRVKFGIDPTSPNIHLGRSVPIMKLRDFQKLGHKIIFIIGDATGVIGDTSDKDSERPMLTKQEVEENAKTYFKQAGRLLDMKIVEKKYNSSWLKKLSFTELGEIANQFSVSDFISRDVIKRRLSEGKRVSLREMLYPIMQGYDSVAVKSDVEVGGSDQLFNVLAGRSVQEHYKQKPQDIITFGLISGTDGRKMSSSWGNTINFIDSSIDMYGKVMSMKDDTVGEYFIYLTRISEDEIKNITEGHPKDAKMRLAYEIVKIHYGENDANKAQESFQSTFKKGGVPDNIPSVNVKKGVQIIDIDIPKEIIGSKNELRRLLEGGSITNTETGEKITDQKYIINKDVTLKIGKRRFIDIKVD